MIKYKSFSTSRKSIENAVFDIKCSLGIENVKCFPVINFLEWILPAIDNKFILEIVPKDELPGKYAMTIPSQHKIIVREDVYEDACNDKSRARFTICHEIAHYFLHGEETVSLYRVASGEVIPAYQDPEWQANVFAGYLLMTPSLIYDMSLEQICKECKVSKKSANIQMKYL